MGFENRRELYKKIEEIRGRPLITYMTSRRQASGGILSMDVIPELCEHISKIPEDKKEIDILISSEGGDPIAAWRIINLLRERFEKIGVLIPYSAQSAATVLALGADEIVMHPFACLGPIDIQINIPGNTAGQLIRFSTEDVSSCLDFIREDLNVKNELLGAEALDYLSSELKPTELGMVKKSMTFIKSIATKLLNSHMNDEETNEKIVEQFTSFSHHGYTIGKKEAISMGLPISKEKMPELEDYMWKVWENADREMKCRVPFDPLSIVGSDEELMKRLNTVPVPSPFGMQNISQNIENISDESIVAMVESDYTESYYKSKAMISATRGNNLSIVCNVAIVSIGWTTRDIMSD